MGLVQFLVKFFIGILLLSPSDTFGWEEDQTGNTGYVVDQGPLDYSQQSQAGDLIMRIRSRKAESGDSEVPVSLDWYKPQIMVPSSYATSLYGNRRSYPSPSEWASANDRLELVQGIKKRYMGMEIPEFITKGDGTVTASMVGNGGGAVRGGGVKQKLLSSG